MSLKTEFLKNSNISLLWTILSDENTMIKNGSKIFVENILNIFRENIIGFCESESKKCVNLFDMNKKYIMLMLNYINSQNKKNMYPVKSNIVKEKTDEKILITYEEIQNNRQSQFEQDLSKRQSEFTNAMSLSVPPVPDFSIKLDEEPIREISEKIKQITAQRNYDIEQINKNYLNSQQNFTKPQETSIKNEKLTPILSKTISNNNTNNTPNLKYIKIDNNEELDSSIYRSQVIDLNSSQENKKHVSWGNEVMRNEVMRNEVMGNEVKNDMEEINIFSKLKKVSYLDEDIINNSNNSNSNNNNMNYSEDKIIVLQEEIKDIKSKMEIINENMNKIMDLLESKLLTN